VSRYESRCKACGGRRELSASGLCSEKCKDRWLKRLAEDKERAKRKGERRRKKKERNQTKEQRKIERLQESNAKLKRQNARLKVALGRQETVDQFYQSREWQELRYKVLKKYGRRCMCCGTTKGVIQVDHIKPRSKYPMLALVQSNLQVLCRDCNLGKSNIDETDFREGNEPIERSKRPND